MAELLTTLAIIAKLASYLEGPGGDLMKQAADLAKRIATGDYTPATRAEVDELNAQMNAIVVATAGNVRNGRHYFDPSAIDPNAQPE